MEQGYEDSRFQRSVDRNLHCPICLNVLRDPVQCRRNQHYFCSPCIKKHLKNTPKCPTCLDQLTEETLGQPARMVVDLLSGCRISCDYENQGCREVVELGDLNFHVTACEFRPVTCSNDQCTMVISHRDREIHESKVCGFRKVRCDYCAEEVQYMNYKEHICPARKEIDEIKLGLADINAHLNEIRSSQNEIRSSQNEIRSSQNEIRSSQNEIRSSQNEIRSSQDEIRSSLNEMLIKMRDLIAEVQVIKNTYTDSKQAQESSSCRMAEEEIIIAGGVELKSVEIYNLTTKMWSPMAEMTECCAAATSFIHNNHMVVTGGFSGGKAKNSVEELNITQKDGQWFQSVMKLHDKIRGHKTVLYQDRLIVTGGVNTNTVNSNTIHEILLAHPYSSKLLTQIPLPRSFHGAELIDGKVYIVGGKERDFQASNAVVMYDPLTNSCEQIAPLPYAVALMATVAWQDNIVVIGGVNELSSALDTVVMYNVITGNHTMLQKMKQKRYGCTAVTTGNNIIVMGGHDGHRPLNSVECYSFDTKEWQDLPPMMKPRWYATAVVKCV